MTVAVKKSSTSVARTVKTSRNVTKTVKSGGEVAVKTKGEVTLTAFTKAMLEAYGRHVVEHRAVPDFRDGLKPVHRCIIWAAYNLDDGGFKKAARVVGDVLGKYHPHGDQSVYDALVGLAGVPTETKSGWTVRHSQVPLLEGYGNFGSHSDSAAAYRYTECRLSKFSKAVLLDKNYLAVTDYVPNFSEDYEIPLILPAKLPLLLLNGSTSIAVGISGATPAFKPAGVIKATIAALKAKEYLLDAKELTKMLDPTFAYGGEFVGGKKQLYELVKTGKGSLLFRPTYEVGAKSMTLTSICPGLSSTSSITKMLDKVADIKGVQFAGDSSDRLGLRYEILFQRGVSMADGQRIVKEVEKIVTKSESYDIGVTIRERVLDKDGNAKATAKFKRLNIPHMLAAWCDWRVDLEVKMLKHLISLEEEKLRRQKLLLLAVDSLDIIVASLKVEDSEAFLVKKLKITLDEAREILDLKVRQLKRLERKVILETIKKIELAIKTFRLELKKPAERIIKNIEADKLGELAGC